MGNGKRPTGAIIESTARLARTANPGSGIQERIEAAHARACNHYSLSYALRIGNEDVAFNAVKKLLPSEYVISAGAGAATGASLNVRRAELILSRADFDQLVEKVGSIWFCTHADSSSPLPLVATTMWKRGNASRQAIKDAVVIEIGYNGAINEWRVDAKEPFTENDPTGATVRLNVYQRNKAQ